MYDIPSVAIAIPLFLVMLVAIEAGFRIGKKQQSRMPAAAKGQTSAVQNSLLGVLALLLGFTFSLSLQRFDERSAAVVEEANAIGTALLRADALQDPHAARAKSQLSDYVDLRVEAGGVALVSGEERERLGRRALELHAALWQTAMAALNDDDRAVTTGYFIQALNALIDSYGSRDAALSRHVPQLVLILMFLTFVLVSSIMGFSAGTDDNRPTSAVYTMAALIVLLVFLIIDLDRPRRGLIEVDQQSLRSLQLPVPSSIR